MLGTWRITIPSARAGLCIIGLAWLMSLSACVDINPMIQAASWGDTKTVLALLAQGASVNQKDPEQSNYTALHAAAEGGHIDVIRVLLDRGADVQATNNFGVTPLLLASTGGHIEVTRLLLDRGADVDTQSRQRAFGVPPGWTPLHFAADAGNLEMVRLLLQRGAKTTLTSTDGKTPAQVARARGHANVAQLIEQESTAVGGTAPSVTPPPTATPIPPAATPVPPVRPSSPPPPPIY